MYLILYKKDGNDEYQDFATFEILKEWIIKNEKTEYNKIENIEIFQGNEIRVDLDLDLLI